MLVHEIDPLARNLTGYATIKAILKQKGVRLILTALQLPPLSVVAHQVPVGRLHVGDSHAVTIEQHLLAGT